MRLEPIRCIIGVRCNIVAENASTGEISCPKVDSRNNNGNHTDNRTNLQYLTMMLMVEEM